MSPANFWIPLIIGIICGICLSLLHMPYAMLISVIVGITNIIPVFGPFFGAIPSAFILLLTDLKCLIFIVFVIILQQVDGNIIGPRFWGIPQGFPRSGSCLPCCCLTT
mgnify:CR=1 FL=1